MNPLICYLQPKDIKEVQEELSRIPCDKLYIKYYAYPNPHRIARDYFLEHPEYDWLVFLTNDLIATRYDFESIKGAIKKHPMIEVVCGVCNVDLEDNKDYWNVCYNLPTLELNSRRYHWVKRGSFSEIQRVRFAGFPFMWIKREVVESLMSYIHDGKARAGFDGTDLFGKDGYAADLWFCHACYHSNIPIYCMPAAEMKHLRFYGEMLVGKRKPITELYNSKTGLYTHLKEYDMDIIPDNSKQDLVKFHENVKNYQLSLEKERIQSNKNHMKLV